jgi:hypothetical protein
MTGDQAKAIAKTVMVRDMLVGLARNGDLDAVAKLAESYQGEPVILGSVAAQLAID